VSGEYLAVSKLVSLAQDGRVDFHRTSVESSSRLEWMTDYVDRLTYEQAVLAAAAVGDGWRLPSMHELYGLVDLSRSSPALRDGFACPRHGGIFWSYQPSCYSSLDRWAVDFEYGYAVLMGKSELACVRLVREVG
jgi:hypothetical protein